MNSDSVREVVDVELWSGILTTFGLKSEAPTWLVVPENPRIITVAEFYDLAMTTEDYRELSAIALFVLYNKFPFHEFEKRCLKRMVECNELNVFVNAMLYCSDYSNFDQNPVFRDLLTNGKYRNYLEFTVALSTVNDLRKEEISRMLQIISDSYRQKKYSVYSEVNVFKFLIEVGTYLKELCPPFIKSLIKCTKTFPKSTNQDVRMCGAFGLDYFSILILTFKMEKTVHDKGREVAKVLLETMGVKFAPWNSDEKELVKALCKKVYSFQASCVNVKNFAWLVEEGLCSHFTVNLRDSEVLAVLRKVRYRSVRELIGEIDFDFAVQNFKMYEPIFDTLFSQYNSKYSNLYQRIREKKKYIDFEASYLSDFSTKESFDLMKVLREDRESTPYQLLMKKAITFSPVLTEEENKELEEEVWMYNVMFGDGDTDYENDCDECEDDYDEDDYDEYEDDYDEYEDDYEEEEYDYDEQ